MEINCIDNVNINDMSFYIDELKKFSLIDIGTVALNTNFQLLVSRFLEFIRFYKSDSEKIL